MKMGLDTFENFADEDFDVKAWVDEQVRASRQLEGGAKAGDEYLSTLAAANKAIDDAASKLFNELPHALTDLNCVGRDASLLAQQVAQVLDKVSEVERSGQQTLSALATLDAIKARMEECAHTLGEAEGVTRTLAQIEPLFQADDMRSIASQLASLRRGLEAMGPLEEFSEAAGRLTGFEDRLEKRVSAKLKQGIEQLDAAAARDCIHIYEQMQRRDVLVTRYVQARKPELVKVFSVAAAAPPAGSAGAEGGSIGSGAIDRLGRLLRELEAAVARELAWCEDVMPDGAAAAALVAALFREAMETLAPAVQSQVLDKVLKGDYGVEALEVLQAAHAACAEFAVNVAAMLAGGGAGAGGAAAVAEADGAAGRAPNGAAAAAGGGGGGGSGGAGRVDEAMVLGAAMCVMDKYQREYADRESAVLTRALDQRRAAAAAARSFDEGVRLMQEATAAAFPELLAAAERAMSFTAGAEAVGIVRMIDLGVESLVGVLRAALAQLRAHAALDPPPPASAAAVGSTPSKAGAGAAGGPGARGGPAGAGARPTAADEALEDDIGLDGVDGDLGGAESDWTFVQGALSVRAVADSAATRLHTLDRALRDLLLRRAQPALEPPTLARARARPLCVYVHGDAAKLASLGKLVARAAAPDFVTLVRAPTLVEGLRAAAETLLVDAALAHVRRRLDELPKLRVWGEGRRGGGGGGHLPSFSCSPLGYVTAIGEHLFSIPEQLCGGGGGDGDDGGGGAGEAMMRATMARITAAVTSLFYDAVMAIPALSAGGRAQLAADTQYLSSILRRLGAPEGGVDRLDEVRRLLEAADDGLAQACVGLVLLDRDAVDRIARKRQAGSGGGGGGGAAQGGQRQ